MMGLGRWRPTHLLGAWAAYWAGLAAVTLGPAVPALWHVTHLPETGQGSISLGASDGAIQLLALDSGVRVWEGTVHLLPLSLWIALPPLALWVAWLVAARRRDPLAMRGAAPAVLDAEAGARALSPGEPGWNGVPQAREAESLARERSTPVPPVR